MADIALGSQSRMASPSVESCIRYWPNLSLQFWDATESTDLCSEILNHDVYYFIPHVQYELMICFIINQAAVG